MLTLVIIVGIRRKIDALENKPTKILRSKIKLSETIKFEKLKINSCYTQKLVI